MVDKELIESTYDEPVLKLVMAAFETLARHGVFLAQVESNKAAVIGDFEDTNPEELADKILQVRMKNRALLAMHELGAQQDRKD